MCFGTAIRRIESLNKDRRIGRARVVDPLQIRRAISRAVGILVAAGNITEPARWNLFGQNTVFVNFFDTVSIHN